MPEACTEFQAMIQSDLDGDLARADRARLRAHLDACGACSTALAAGRIAIATLAALPAPEPGPAFAAQVAIRARLARARMLRRRAWMGWGVAASVFLASAAALEGWVSVLRPGLDAVLPLAAAILAKLLPVVAALGGALATIGRALMSVGGAATKLSWIGLASCWSWYAVALGVLALVAAVARKSRAAARLPVLSF